MSQYYEELVSQFTDVTGVDKEQARFYLESAAWQLEVALVSFYESGNDDRQQTVNVEDNEVQEITGSDAPGLPLKGQQGMMPKTGSKGGITNSRFVTLSNFQNKDTSSDEEEGQAFYAGGSENSGQQVLGPGKKKNSIVSQLFKSAQEHGAEVVDPHQPATSKKKTFSGLGYRLGQSNNDSEAVGTPSSEASSSKNEVNVTLKMWHDGFSINEGPLRRYSDPDTREFLSVVGRGEIPDELLKEAQGSEVHLNMEDHSHEEYVPTKPKLKAFSGKGSMLGSPASNILTDTVSTTSEQDRSCNEDKAKEELVVNSAAPTTTIQVRLADGSRLSVTLNHTHTVGDLRQFIKTARPEYNNKQFNLMTTFPKKDLDDNTTVFDAGILNSAIMQRLT